MEKLHAPTTTSAVKLAPRVQDSQAVVLLRRIDTAVRRASSGRIHKLRVELVRGQVVLSGFCSTFYAKQLAQHAAMPLAEGRTLDNRIEVW